MRINVIIPIFLMIGINICHSQVVVLNSGGLPILYAYGENSAETAQQYKNHDAYLKDAYAAYEAGDLEKTKYHLDHAEKRGVVSPEFYLLLGQYFYVKGQYRYAKRYWKRGFSRGCWECKEKISTIPD